MSMMELFPLFSTKVTAVAVDGIFLAVEQLRHHRSYCGTTTARKFDIKGIAVLPKPKRLSLVPGLKLNAVSAKHPLSEQKLSTFSLWLRANSDIGKQDIEVCKSRWLNGIWCYGVCSGKLNSG